MSDPHEPRDASRGRAAGPARAGRARGLFPGDGACLRLSPVCRAREGVRVRARFDRRSLLTSVHDVRRVVAASRMDNTADRRLIRRQASASALAGVSSLVGRPRSMPANREAQPPPSSHHGRKTPWIRAIAGHGWAHSFCVVSRGFAQTCSKRSDTPPTVPERLPASPRSAWLPARCRLPLPVRLPSTIDPVLGSRVRRSTATLACAASSDQGPSGIRAVGPRVWRALDGVLTSGDPLIAVSALQRDVLGPAECESRDAASVAGSRPHGCAGS
jgi:hypothetical protein